MSKKKSLTTSALPVPQNQVQADNVIYVIGDHKRALDALIVKRDRAVADAAAKYADAIAEAGEVLKANVESLQAFAEANKSALLQDGKRSIAFPSGLVGWRYSNPAVKFDADDEERLIARLRTLGLGHLIREKSEIDKTAVVKHAAEIEGVKGIDIVQEERFFVRPLEVEDDIAGKARKLTGPAAIQAPDAPAKKTKSKAPASKRKAA
ncbi:MAG: host-nuclease inhibitor Gam family protein [Tagaea sp.]|nr:host-nuclease inhibitor Gam family protein [Tagaea sp.]